MDCIEPAIGFFFSQQYAPDPIGTATLFLQKGGENFVLSCNHVLQESTIDAHVKFSNSDTLYPVESTRVLGDYTDDDVGTPLDFMSVC
jgi:hypothetical protein